MKEIKVSDECFARLQEEFNQGNAVEVENYEGLVGKKLFVRTVTYHILGRVVGIMGSFLKMENASWVADSGRFADAIGKGTLSEVEPVGVAFVNIDSVTDMFPWNFDLPTAQK